MEQPFNFYLFIFTEQEQYENYGTSKIKWVEYINGICASKEELFVSHQHETLLGLMNLS